VHGAVLGDPGCEVEKTTLISAKVEEIFDKRRIGG
jgi:hypothetical protein